MKRLSAFFALFLIAFLLPPTALAAVKGGKCSTIGAFESGFVCMKIGTQQKWQVFDSTEGVQAAINLALKSTKLPKNLLPALEKVRSNKSPWLDQACAVDFPDVKVPECIGGDLQGKKVLVLYGDSHASMWMPVIESIAKQGGYKVYLFAKLACPLVETTIWSYQLNKPFDECTAWQQLVLPKIQALNPDLLIVTDQWKPAVVDGKKSDFDTPGLWQSEFPKALTRLAGYTKRLVVIGNNPSMLQDSVACASKPNANLALCGSGRAQAGNVQINGIERDAAQAVGATYIDTVDWACTQYLCPVVINNIFVYFDQWHFTATYVNWLKPVLRKALGI